MLLLRWTKLIVSDSRPRNPECCTPLPSQLGNRETHATVHFDQWFGCLKIGYPETFKSNGISSLNHWAHCPSKKKLQCSSIFKVFQAILRETHLETASVISLFTCRIFGAKNAQVLMVLFFLLWSSSLCENVLQLAMKAMAHRNRWFLYKMLLKKCDFRVCKLWNYRISRLSFKPTAFDDVSSDIKWLPKSQKNQTH